MDMIEDKSPHLDFQKDSKPPSGIEQIIRAEIKDCPPEIIRRFQVLENHRFNSDLMAIRRGVIGVLKAMKEKGGLITFSEEREHMTSLAALVHDIGKSSLSEDPAAQVAVAALFAAKEGVSGTEKVGEVVKKKFPEAESNTIMQGLSVAGIKPEMLMRDFDRHALWTKEIMEKYPKVFSKEVIIIAASHHIGVNNNPCRANEEEILDELKASIYLVMTMDQYQARFTRGKVTHEQAILWLRNNLANKYGNPIRDPILAYIVNTMEELGKKVDFLAEVAKKV